MRAFNFKLILLAALFAALVVKGGQLCSADGVQAMTRLVERGRPAPVEPVPLKPVEEEFRGVSPLPELSSRVTPSRKTVKQGSKLNVRKTSKAQSVSKNPARKPPGKS
ncbi:MAG: hypothetical protein ACOZEN_03045 [Thermodesulfobacteriota bacterium]